MTDDLVCKRIFNNDLAGIQRNSHTIHLDYRTAFAMGPAVDPFAENVIHPISPHVVNQMWMQDNNDMYDRLSKSGGAHYYESWTDAPEHLVVPFGPQLEAHQLPPVPPPIQGPMPLLNSFFRHTDHFYVNHPYALLLMQVRHRLCFPIPVPIEQVY